MEPQTLALAVQQRPHPHTGRSRVTVFFHAQTTEARDGWTHTVAGRDGDQDSGMAFRCYFVPLQEAVGLPADSQDDFIHLVEHGGAANAKRWSDDPRPAAN